MEKQKGPQALSLLVLQGHLAGQLLLATWMGERNVTYAEKQTKKGRGSGVQQKGVYQHPSSWEEDREKAKKKKKK